MPDSIQVDGAIIWSKTEYWSSKLAPEASLCAMRFLSSLINLKSANQSATINQAYNNNSTMMEDSQELDRLEQECTSMICLLKELEREELELLQQNKILAREALLCGYQPHLLEPPAPKRRRIIKKKEED